MGRKMNATPGGEFDVAEASGDDMGRIAEIAGEVERVTFRPAAGGIGMQNDEGNAKVVTSVAGVAGVVGRASHVGRYRVTRFRLTLTPSPPG